MVTNKSLFRQNSEIHNHLPSNIKLLSKDIKEFKFLLKSYLTKHAFYSKSKKRSKAIPVMGCEGP
jgi:hypothetical protein